MKIASEGLPFALPLAALALGVGWLADPWLSLPLWLLLIFTLWFFRDPERRPPDDRLALISPADGKIIKAGQDEISVFMNVFDVHVCRAPMSGRVVEVNHVRGSFLAAYKHAASQHNERASIQLREGQRELTFTLVAGLIARRIVCKVAAGQRVRAGDRVGLIRFGSRVDLILPPGSTPTVRIGDRVRAGESIVARRPPES